MGQFAAPRGLAATRTLRSVLEASGGRPSHIFRPGRPSDFPELRGAVRPHAFGWPALSPFATCGRYSDGRAVHGRRGRAPKTPTLLDVLWVRGRLKLQNHERSLPRVLNSNLRVTASPTRVSLGVASCQSEILSLKKAVWRLWLVSKSRTKSSAEGCEQLLRRVASADHRLHRAMHESPCLELYAAGFDARL